LVVAILFTLCIILLLVMDIDLDVDYDIDVTPAAGAITTSNQFKASRVVVGTAMGKRRLRSKS